MTRVRIPSAARGSTYPRWIEAICDSPRLTRGNAMSDDHDHLIVAISNSRFWRLHWHQGSNGLEREFSTVRCECSPWWKRAQWSIHSTLHARQNFNTNGSQGKYGRYGWNNAAILQSMSECHVFMPELCVSQHVYSCIDLVGNSALFITFH